jgi:hypothetical protein
MHETYEKLPLPSGSVLPLEYRVEQETAGMLKWRVRDPDGNPPEFLVTLLGATVSKVEELHRRTLNDDDIRIGIVNAILRAQEYLNARLAEGEEPPAEETVMIRDSDFAELTDSKTTRVNDVP